MLRLQEHHGMLQRQHSNRKVQQNNSQSKSVPEEQSNSKPARYVSTQDQRQIMDQTILERIFPDHRDSTLDSLIHRDVIMTSLGELVVSNNYYYYYYNLFSFVPIEYSITSSFIKNDHGILMV